MKFRFGFKSKFDEGFLYGTALVLLALMIGEIWRNMTREGIPEAAQTGVLIFGSVIIAVLAGIEIFIMYKISQN